MPDEFDPISERLHQLDPGGAMKPPTPAEIRRRGDRMRRRNTTLAAVGAVVAVAVIATPVAVFAGGSGGGNRDIGPVTDPPSATSTPSDPLEDTDLISVEDLPALPDGFEPWTEQPGSPGVVLTCQPGPLDSLGAVEARSREFTTYITPGEANVSGSTEPTRRIREVVLRFDTADAAAAAYDEAQSWVEECSDPIGTTEKVFPNGKIHQGSIDGADSVFRGWVYGAPEFCPEGCDAAWFPQEGVALLGDRLVLLEYTALAGPLSPEGQGDDMEGLLAATVDRAGRT